MSNFTFACVLRSGGVYTPQWVERLCRQAREHLNPSRIVCLTDCGAFTWTCATLPLIHNWPSWFSKIELFRPGLFEGPVVYFDLDSVLVKPIEGLDHFMWSLGHVPKLCLLDDFYAPKRAATGVMMWTPCAQTEAIYHEFARNPVCKPGWSNGDGAHIGQFPHLRLQTLFPGAFGSWKKDKLEDGPKGFAHVSFHGTPKFNDLPADSWIVRHWLGEPNNQAET